MLPTITLIIKAKIWKRRWSADLLNSQTIYIKYNIILTNNEVSNYYYTITITQNFFETKYLGTYTSGTKDYSGRHQIRMNYYLKHYQLHLSIDIRTNTTFTTLRTYLFIWKRLSVYYENDLFSLVISIHDQTK